MSRFPSEGSFISPPRMNNLGECIASWIINLLGLAPSASTTLKFIVRGNSTTVHLRNYTVGLVLLVKHDAQGLPLPSCLAGRSGCRESAFVVAAALLKPSKGGLS